MALGQHLRLKPYREFFQQKIQEGETVILDNGAYEGVQADGAQLAFWVKEIKPTVVVLPDKPGDFVKTVRKSWTYLDDYGLPKGTEGMLVLHAQDTKLGHFETAYSLCPVKWVGFSRLTKSYTLGQNWPDHRYLFARWLKANGRWRSELTHHALGMLNGDVEELRDLAAQGFHSCDSSAPIWRGMHGYTLQDAWPNYELQPKPDETFNWNWQLAESNLKSVLEACDGKS